MKKTFHIIPGWEDSCEREPYIKLAEIARNKGYEVMPHEVDWKKPLSLQKFPVSPEDTIFGFSLGAILGWLIAQEYPCQHLIFASGSPHYSFTEPKLIQAFKDLCGIEFTDDIIAHLKSEHKALRQTTVYGDKEGEKADILVPETDHELTDAYIEEISKIL